MATATAKAQAVDKRNSGFLIIGFLVVVQAGFLSAPTRVVPISIQLRFDWIQSNDDQILDISKYLL
jgi:hypothetical protein